MSNLVRIPWEAQCFGLRARMKETHEMKINKNKSKLVYMSDRQEKVNDQVEGKNKLLHINGENKYEVMENKTWRYRIIKALKRKTKIKVYNSIYRPIMTYGCGQSAVNNEAKCR